MRFIDAGRPRRRSAGRLVAALLLAAAPLARAESVASGPSPHRPQRPPRPPRRTPPPRPRPSPVSTSTASPCSTWATRRARTTRTGPTCCGPPSCRPSRTSSARTATTSPACARAAGLQGLRAHERGRGQDHLRVRALRYRRRRRPDHVPPAPCLGRARPGRSRADLEPVHGHRRVPQLHRVLGAERHGLLPERPAPVDALVQRGLAVRGGPRASRRLRRSGPVRRPHRAAGRQGPLPPARPLRALPQGGRLRPRPVLRHPAPDQVGRPERRRRRPLGQGHRLGPAPELEPQARESTWPGARWSTARASRTT